MLKEGEMEGERDRFSSDTTSKSLAREVSPEPMASGGDRTSSEASLETERTEEEDRPR
jgi:hypothetical protein